MLTNGAFSRRGQQLIIRARRTLGKIERILLACRTLGVSGRRKTISHERTAAISGPARHSADPHVRSRRGSRGRRGGGDLLFVARLPCPPPPRSTSGHSAPVRQNGDRTVFSSRNKIEISKLTRTRRAYRARKQQTDSIDLNEYDGRSSAWHVTVTEVGACHRRRPSPQG